MVINMVIMIIYIYLGIMVINMVIMIIYIYMGIMVINMVINDYIYIYIWVLW